MNDFNFGYSVPYELARREEVSVEVGIFDGYQSIDCLRLTHSQLPPILSNQDKVELGKVIVPFTELPFLVAKLISLLVEFKDARAFKNMNEQRLELLIKVMDDFMAIERES